MGDELRTILDVRARRPQAIAEAAAARKRRAELLGEDDRLFIIAADHPARGALGAGDRPMAMADRGELLSRMSLALSRPGVDGVLGTADIIEDLLLLGALDDKVVIGSMNRGGLAGTVFEIDDRFTGYDAATIARMGFDGGKMLFRIDPNDPATAVTMESCARAVSDLAARGLMALVEPFISHRVSGRVRNDLSPEAVTRSIVVASGLGVTSAYTWLKVPVVDDMERVLAASTLPALLLGGEVSADQDAAFGLWYKALQVPSVRGLVVGRMLLFPSDDDVAGAVDAAVGLMRGLNVDDKLYLPAASSASGDGSFRTVVTPERAGWTYSVCACWSCPRPGPHLGQRRRRAARPATVRLGHRHRQRRDLRAAGTPRRVLPGQRLRLRPAGRDRHGGVRERRQVRPAQRAVHAQAHPPLRPG